MNKLKILVVEGNTKEENVNFNQAGCVSQSENFSKHIKMHEPDCDVDIITHFKAPLLHNADISTITGAG